MLLPFKHLKKTDNSTKKAYLVEDILLNTNKIISVREWVPEFTETDGSFCVATIDDGRRVILKGTIEEISTKINSTSNKGLLNG